MIKRALQIMEESIVNEVVTIDFMAAISYAQAEYESFVAKMLKFISKYNNNNEGRTFSKDIIAPMIWLKIRSRELNKEILRNLAL